MKATKPILLLTIITIIFIIISKYYVENFIVYNNTIKTKSHYLSIDDKYISKYFIDSLPDNDLTVIYNLTKIFNINDNTQTIINISENIKWTNWVSPNTSHLKIHNKFIDYIENIIQFYDIKIIHSYLKNVKINYNSNNNILLNIDLLLYQANNLNGKHINILVYYNNDKFFIIYINLIGIVNEFNIKNNLYLKDINIENSVDNISNITNKNNKFDCVNCDTSKTIKDEYVEESIKNILLENLNTKSYNVNDLIDIKKNIKYKKNEDIVKKHLMNKLFKPTIVTPSNY
jgi:hypothetical protein